MADKKMHGKILMLIGIILVLDALIGVQLFFQGITVTTGINGIELILGVIIAGLGYKTHEMKN